MSYGVEDQGIAAADGGSFDDEDEGLFLSCGGIESIC